MADSRQSSKRDCILNMIHHLGPISRTELIELTDYRPATVSEIIKELMDEGLVVESGHVSSGLGRKRVMLEIHYSRICAISIAITAQSVIYVAAQLNGEILRKLEVSVDPALPKLQLSEQIAGQLQGLLAEFADKEIVGIGICEPFYDPARYRSDDPELHGHAQFNRWIHQDLKQRLDAISGKHTQIFSPVILPVVAEQRYGTARDAQNFICVELSNGIGASICCNGRPVAGAHGVAGELGHTVIDSSSLDAPLCYCGKPGCVERTTAFPALQAQIQSALDRGVFSVLRGCGALTVQQVRRALDAGDRMCRHYVKEAAVRLGAAIANAVNLLNPELVVLYGFMLELGEYFLQNLELSIRENTVLLAGDFRICTTSSMENLLPLGAVAELFTTYLKMDDYKWVYQLSLPEENRA